MGKQNTLSEKFVGIINVRFLLLVLFSFATSVARSQLPDTWTQKADFGDTGRQGPTGFSIASKGYLGTGYDNYTNTYYKDFWEYDPQLNAWTQKADLMGLARDFAVAFNIGSKGYLGTGYSGYPVFECIWLE